MQSPHRFTGGAEHQRRAGLDQAQHIDRGQLHFAGGDAHGAIVDVGVRRFRSADHQTQGVALIGRRQRHDGPGQGGGKQQGAPFLGRGVENLLDLLTETQVEHLVGLVQDHRAQLVQPQIAAFQVVPQASGRADDDVTAGVQRAPLGARVHAADAGDHLGAGVEPAELPLHLHGQFARGGDHQGLGRAGRGHGAADAQQGFGEDQAIGHGLA